MPAFRAAVLVLILALLAVSPARAAGDTVASQIDDARTLYHNGDLAKAAAQLEAALIDLQNRLGAALAPMMPPPPAGWEAAESETQGVGIVGGGITVMRAYSKGDASMNATLIMDNPAVAGTAAAFDDLPAAAAQPGMKALEINGQSALLRWDDQVKAGELTMVLGKRVMLLVEGNDIPGPEPMIAAAKGWNIAGIRKQAGL